MHTARGGGGGSERGRWCEAGRRLNERFSLLEYFSYTDLLYMYTVHCTVHPLSEPASEV
jgi:hypothetical protein